MTSPRKTINWTRLLRGEPGLLAGSTLLAAITMMWPFSVRSDAVYWMLWGRELTQFTLDTGTGWTSWKPLPIPFTTVYSLFGDSAASALWMLTSRTATFFAAVLVFRLVRRFADQALKPIGIVSILPGVMGGLMAALWTLRVLVGFTALGYAEGFTLALVLLAVERAIDGKHKIALVFGFAACLSRPEPLALMMIYALWLWFKQPALRKWLVAGPVFVVAAWLIPDWIGSGDPLRARYLGGVKRIDMSYPGDGKPLRMIKFAFTTLPNMALYALPLGVVAALWQAKKERLAPVALLGLALTWVGLVAFETAQGTNGLPRYMFGAQACLIIVAGFGVAVLVGPIAKALNSAGMPLEGALAIPVLTAMLATGVFAQKVLYPRVAQAKSAQAKFAEADATLTDVINAAGGPKKVIACGPVSRFALFDPTIAWKLGETSSVLSYGGGPDDPNLDVQFKYGSTFRLYIPIGRRPLDAHIRSRIAPGAKRVAEVGDWVVYQRCLKWRNRGTAKK
ncbi:MAG: hypothetical protein NTY57_05495 [Solirubrobacterales bacterium]|nr:hypothetical protein [Solirubrobacterales bacterium]